MAVVYSPSPTDFSAAMAAGMYGYGSGWNVMASTGGDTPLFLSEQEMNSLYIDGNCVFQ